MWANQNSFVFSPTNTAPKCQLSADDTTMGVYACQVNLACRVLVGFAVSCSSAPARSSRRAKILQALSPTRGGIAPAHNGAPKASPAAGAAGDAIALFAMFFWQRFREYGVAVLAAAAAAATRWNAACFDSGGGRLERLPRLMPRGLP